MSRKSILFASVAAPLVSLPLLIQPAAAMPPKAAFETGSVPGVIQVQQQIIIPPGEGGEEGQPRPRRKDGGGQGEGGAQREQAPAETQQSEQPRRQRQAEPEAAPREAPAAEAPAQERPRRQQQDAGQGSGESQPRRERQREQAAPEAEQPSTREAQPRNDAAPEGSDRQQRRNAQDRNAAPADSQADTPAPRPRAKDRAATPEAQPEKPASRNAEGQGAGEGAGGGSGTAQGNRAQQPAKPPATDQAAPAQPKPGQPAPGQAAPGQAAPGQANQGSTPQGEQPRRQSTEGQTPQPVPGQAPAEQAAPGQPPAAAPGQVAPGQAQQGQAQQGLAPAGQPQTAQTPEQVERAKELARDPASAKSGEQVVLPVENGAAVLDSAKEAPSARPAAPGGNAEQPRRQQTQQADQQQLAPPKSDAEAQSATRATRDQQRDFQALVEERGERLDRRPDFERPRGWEYREFGARDGTRRDRDRDDTRVIISIDNQTVVRHDDSRRFYVDGREPEYERLRDGRVREVIVREDGTRIVTVRNSYGEIVQRSRVVKGGEEYVLYYSPELMENRRGRDYVWRDPGQDLPPMRLTVPVDDYIIDTSTEPDRDYYEFLEQPPVERVERVYSLDEVRYSARIRDKVRRIDLDTVTFATGSAEIPMNQASSLRKVADAISKVLDKDPSETFLIEGHTDAVGSDDSNLVLSDQRAESVARVLTDAFGIPPENLATQGYGERYLKVRTDGPEQENRRVTVRRITPLVKPVAAKQ